MPADRPVAAVDAVATAAAIADASWLRASQEPLKQKAGGALHLKGGLGSAGFSLHAIGDARIARREACFSDYSCNAASVAESSFPVTPSPRMRWNLLIADEVPGPGKPSTLLL